MEEYDVESILDMYEDSYVREPSAMAQGGRIPFDNGGEALSKKEKIAQGLEKSRQRSPAILDMYRNQMRAYNLLIKEAFATENANLIPKSFADYLKANNLKEGTYGNLKAFDLLPEITLPAKARTELANLVINNYNNQLKFKELNKILKDAKFTDKQINALSVNADVLKADKAADKARKAYDFILRRTPSSLEQTTERSPQNLKNLVTSVFDPRAKIAELTGLTGETISKKFNIKKYDPEGYKMYELLSNPQVKKSLQSRIDKGANITIQKFFNEVENMKKGLPSTAAKIAAETRKGRLKVAAKKAGESVADINAAQDELIATLNKFYKENPQELLNNTKLRNLLDLTLKDGEIVKKNKYVTDEDFLKLIKEKTGLFTKDHVDEVQFEKLSTEFPIFKQLATYNTNSGLIKSIKSYVAKNQNSTDPVVQDKIKKQIEFLEDLKLRIDTPTGRVGSKEVLAAVDRQAGILPNFLAQLKALNIKLPAKAKAVLLGTGGGLAATTLAAAGPIEETGSTAIDTAKTAGAATAGALGFGTKTGRKILGKGVNLGFGPTGILGINAFLGVDPKESLDRAMLGVEGALLPSAVKGTLSVTDKIKNPFIKKAVERATLAGMSPTMALRFARVANPIGIATLAGEGLYQLGKRGYDQYQAMQDMTEQEKSDFLADQYESLGGVFGEGA